ncbi:MAG TPA: hypothetical protein PLA83_14410, partial [Deltaproteobacteria bacterium]|nr:hypothetical protein [Deltaproteobacteria bacterium]
MKTDDLQARIEEAESRVIGGVLRKAGVRRLVFSVGQNLVDGWVQDKPFRKRIAGPVRWLLEKAKGRRVGTEASGMAYDLGTLVTLWAQKVNADHKDDAGLHARSRSEAFKGFIETTDFGEIAEMLENSGERMVKSVEAINEHLWKYPAKIASVLAALLASLNTSIRASREAMRPIEKNVAPDLLADMMLSLMKGVRGRDAGDLVNASCEMLRRLHTGSLLLGRGGKPLFQIHLSELLKECIPAINPEILGKARIALAEDREAATHALADALIGNPGHVISYVSSLGSVKNPSIRAASRRMRIIGDIDQEDLSKAAAKAAGDIDTYEIAGLVNDFLNLLNRLHESNPDLFTSTASSIADSIDGQEVRKAADWIIPGVIEAFGPVLSEIMPSLMKGVREMIDPQGRFG